MGAVYQPKPGDAVVATTRTLYGTIIRFGQAIRWWKYRKWNHMAIVVKVDPDGTVWCLQMVKQCSLVKMQDIARGGHIKVIPCPEDVNAEMAVAYAMKQLGIDYGVITIISIAINMCLPQVLDFDIRLSKTLICSALVARSWEYGGWVCGDGDREIDPFQITPAEFDEALGDTGVVMYFPIHG